MQRTIVKLHLKKSPFSRQKRKKWGSYNIAIPFCDSESNVAWHALLEKLMLFGVSAIFSDIRKNLKYFEIF
jgi:hypothetical protein